MDTELNPKRDRAHRLVESWGWNATSFQTLSPQFSYWFSDDGCVAYVEHGGAWVSAGAPIAAPKRLAQVTQGFVAAALSRGKRASFFAVEPRFLEATGMPSFALGEQPVYDPQTWQSHLRSSRSLREQLRRARAKGLRVSQTYGEADHIELERVHRLWLLRRPLDGMGFLTGLDPFTARKERRYFVARSVDDGIVGFAALSPVYARRGWLFEHLIRVPDAPNGTIELLVDAAMCELSRSGVSWATLGLAPLAGDVPFPLKLVRRWAKPLYNFEGLRSFKAKLGPVSWDPVFLAYPNENASVSALCDSLSAFMHGRPFGFATRSLSKQLLSAARRVSRS